MTVKKPIALIPKLRFPEFADEPAWTCPPLSELADRVTTRNSRGVVKRPLTNSAERGVIDQSDYFDKVIANNTDNYFIVETGDFVYNPRVSANAPVGPISRNEVGTGVMSPLYTVFRFEHGVNDYFAHYFKSSHWHHYLRRVSNSGARHDRMAITNDDLMQMPVPMPSIREQREVADCLCSLDEIIASESQKLYVLKLHKNGLMQKLFPLAGETLPRQRFPDFIKGDDWRKTTLGEIATFSKGKGISKADVIENGITPCVRYGELYTTYGEVIKVVKSRTNVDTSELVLSKAGDVIIPASGETKNDIATCSCVVDEGVALGSDLNIIRTSVDGQFLSYYINSTLRRTLAKVAQGDTVAHLYAGQLSQLELSVPKAKAEQKRISECLATLDSLQDALLKKIDCLKLQRTGLLQQVFPSLGSEFQ